MQHIERMTKFISENEEIINKVKKHERRGVKIFHHISENKDDFKKFIKKATLSLPIKSSETSH